MTSAFSDPQLPATASAASPAPASPGPSPAAAGGLHDPAGTWNRRYAQEGYVFGEAPNVWLEQHAGLWQPGQRVLCVADGEGRNSVWLARRGLVVEAFDIAELGVAKARALAAAHGVQPQLTVADCDGYDWPVQACDGVAAIFVQFADPALRRRLFQRVIDCLKPGGWLVLQGYTPRQLEYKTGGPPLVSHLYTPEQLRAELPGLELQVLQEYEAVLAEGSGHKGLSALVGMVARKPLQPDAARPAAGPAVTPSA